MCVFFFNDTATPEIYTLSLHDALPISFHGDPVCADANGGYFESPHVGGDLPVIADSPHVFRSEEHTSELQSHVNLVCRLLLEKKKNHQCSYAGGHFDAPETVLDLSYPS